MSVAVFGPAVEEILKVALVLWIVERRPYLFKRTAEVLLCGLAGGIVFAVIENIVYLQVYIPDPSAEIIRWRWTICVLLHTSCSGIAAWGIGREWRSSMESKRRPQMGNAFGFLVAAVLIHGLYNGVMTLLSMGGYGF